MYIKFIFERKKNLFSHLPNVTIASVLPNEDTQTEITFKEIVSQGKIE